MIDLFRGEYNFLSNFYPSPIKIDGIIYKTVEHAYQAHKSNDVNERKRIADLARPGSAKIEGKELKIRPDWGEVKLLVMKKLLQHKFESPELRHKLLSTKGHKLVETNSWGDTFWGICNGKGENHLGRLLMSVRLNIIFEKEEDEECIQKGKKNKLLY